MAPPALQFSAELPVHPRRFCNASSKLLARSVTEAQQLGSLAVGGSTIAELPASAGSAQAFVTGAPAVLFCCNIGVPCH